MDLKIHNFSGSADLFSNPIASSRDSILFGPVIYFTKIEFSNQPRIKTLSFAF